MKATSFIALISGIIILGMGYMQLSLTQRHRLLKGDYEELQRKYALDSVAWDARVVRDSQIIDTCLGKLDSFSVVCGRQGYLLRMQKSQIAILQKQLKRYRHEHRLLSGTSGRGSYTSGNIITTSESSPPDYADFTSYQGQPPLIHQALYRPASFSEGIDTQKYQRGVVPYNGNARYYHRVYYEEEGYQLSQRSSQIGIGPSIGQALTTDGNLITYIGIGFNFNVIKLK